MKELRYYIVSFTLSLLLLCFGCEQPGSGENSIHDGNYTKKLIVTTTTHINDLVVRLVGDSCKITSLMGPGVDPHSYRPTALDTTAISTADLVIYHGLRLEGKLSVVLKNKNNSKTKTYAICSALPKQSLLKAEGENTQYPDPHVWFSPELWNRCLDGLAKFLIDELPELKNQILEKQKLMETEMMEVSLWAKSQLNKIPPEKRILITSHDAFRYLGKSFGIEVVALQGISTLQEAGLVDRANLVDFINEKKIPCLFIESSVNPKAIREIAKETGAKVGNPLYSDALGNMDSKSEGPNQKFYPHSRWEGMLIHNITSILKGMNN